MVQVWRKYEDKNEFEILNYVFLNMYTQQSKRE